MRYSHAYQEARQLQTALAEVVLNGAEPADKARCVSAWIDLERLKREIRGIPRLKAHSIAELSAGWPAKRAKTITIRDAARTPQTVTPR